MAKQLQPSPIHSLLGISPAHAPQWLRVDDCGATLDFWGLVTGSPIVLGLFAANFYSWPESIPFWLCLIPIWKLEFQFEDCERFARARKRRHECISCGLKLISTEEMCPTCTAKAATRS